MYFKVFHISLTRIFCLSHHIICYCFILLFFSLPAYAEQNDEEGYFLPNFRSGHNLTLFLSGEYSNWSLNQIIESQNQSSSLASSQERTIESAQESKMVMALFFRYTYHINIISSFGFFVGSTAGLFSSNGSYGKQKNLYPGPAISFPTILGGLVQGIGQDFRALAGVEYGAVLFPKMKINTESGTEKELNLVPDMFAIFAGIDNFLTRNTALSFNVGYRQIKNSCLNTCTSPIYANSLMLTNKSYYTQVGVTWLVGELGTSP